MKAINFSEQVACHHEMQAGLRRLFPSRFNRRNMHEFCLNCTIVYNAWVLNNPFLPLLPFLVEEEDVVERPRNVVGRGGRGGAGRDGTGRDGARRGGRV